MGHTDIKKLIVIHLKFRVNGADCFWVFFTKSGSLTQRFVRKHQQPLVSSSEYTTEAAWVHYSNSTH